MMQSDTVLEVEMCAREPSDEAIWKALHSRRSLNFATKGHCILVYDDDKEVIAAAVRKLFEKNQHIEGKPVKLADCPPGLFWSSLGGLFIKTGGSITKNNMIDAYCVSTGEFFGGDAKEQRDSLVTPVGPVVPPGFKIVPERPTEMMFEAGTQAVWADAFTGKYGLDADEISRSHCRDSVIAAWPAMLAAASLSTTPESRPAKRTDVKPPSEAAIEAAIEAFKDNLRSGSKSSVAAIRAAITVAVTFEPGRKAFSEWCRAFPEFHDRLWRDLSDDMKEFWAKQESLRDTVLEEAAVAAAPQSGDFHRDAILEAVARRIRARKTSSQTEGTSYFSPRPDDTPDGMSIMGGKPYVSGDE